MDCIMRYVFSLRVFKQRVHTYSWTGHAPAFNHSFTHSLVVKLCFVTIKYSLIVKVMGLYTMSVSRKNVCAVRCLQMHCFESTTSYLCISCSFPNHLTNVIIYPKTRICFGRLGYTLLEFIIVIIIILMDGILLVFIHATPPTCV